MDLRFRGRAMRAASRCMGIFVAVCAVALAGCNQNGHANLSAAQPRGATVAFESIDGPPSRQFQKLVQSLNDEAQARRLAVISRGQSSAYRVRGYLAAKVVRDNTTISWVWDVFDGNERRALRITGEEVAKGRHSDAWSVADDAMLQRIARTSMDQLAAFVTSAEVAPGTAQAESAAFVVPEATSPEAAGIFRIPRPQVDPASGKSPAGKVPEAATPAPAEAARETPTLLASNG